MSKISVLVVEDEFLIRMDLVDFLSGEGFEVFEAAHADEAIAIREANEQIQVMFTDVDMPGGMDGLKLSAAVRDRWPPDRLVVTSGHCLVALKDLPEGCRLGDNSLAFNGGFRVWDREWASSVPECPAIDPQRSLRVNWPNESPAASLREQGSA